MPTRRSGRTFGDATYLRPQRYGTRRFWVGSAWRELEQSATVVCMAHTEVGAGFAPSDDGCWCCGDRTVRASLLRLQARPEVGVCFRCIGELSTRKRVLERMSRRAPVGPWWRRVQFRVGFNRC